MIFSTLVPLEQVFPSASVPSLDSIPCAHGCIRGRWDKGRFSADQVISTDLSLYLNPTYSPGASSLQALPRRP